jgi:hypothetical protein
MLFETANPAKLFAASTPEKIRKEEVRIKRYRVENMAASAIVQDCPMNPFYVQLIGSTTGYSGLSIMLD